MFLLILFLIYFSHLTRMQASRWQGYPVVLFIGVFLLPQTVSGTEALSQYLLD